MFEKFSNLVINTNIDYKNKEKIYGQQLYIKKKEKKNKYLTKIKLDRSIQILNKNSNNLKLRTLLDFLKEQIK